MSRDVSGTLGEYMLKGWVLTDKTCPNAGCSVPLMRSPAPKSPVIHFCASCDGGPDCRFHLFCIVVNINLYGEWLAIRPPTAQLPDSSASVSSSSHFSRSSTPPTEVSSTLSSPVFAPPAETEESRRRRQQSDEASAAIGQRLLKGWAMLAEECPNDRCFGVPLVRPPKPGEKRILARFDSCLLHNARLILKQECVICKTVYVVEIDWAGRERLVPENATKEITTPTSKGKAREVEVEAPKSRSLQHLESPSTTPQILPAPSANIHASGQATASLASNTMLSTLDESAQELESTLRTLSARLSFLTSSQADPSSIGSVADAIDKVVHALGQVRQLQWAAEKHAAAGL
ncbi:hypothetical protein MVEN_01253100 [Mycena venus]|uniref:Uncharacterized protein n=1 Tax=Mycena venus TaxID=2733690 RepID=A0A8H6Y634_9AGAR|nr:hypothetical protein MVEN_01253100 [Mycena venus]